MTRSSIAWTQTALKTRAACAKSLHTFRCAVTRSSPEMSCQPEHIWRTKCQMQLSDNVISVASDSLRRRVVIWCVARVAHPCATFADSILNHMIISKTSNWDKIHNSLLAPSAHFIAIHCNCMHRKLDNELNKSRIVWEPIFNSNLIPLKIFYHNEQPAWILCSVKWVASANWWRRIYFFEYCNFNFFHFF